MNYRATMLQRTAPFSAGVLIGASIVTPVFAATSDLPEHWQPFVLIGSVILLAIALALKTLGARRTTRGNVPDEAIDMRDANRAGMIDVPMHQLR